MTVLLVTDKLAEFWDATSWGIWKSSWGRVRWGKAAMKRFVFLCRSVAVGEDWPGLGEPWRGNWWGSAAGWCRWTSIDLHNAPAGWQTASVWSRCAGGCPSGRRTCPFCRSGTAHTNNNRISKTDTWTPESNKTSEKHNIAQQTTCFWFLSGVAPLKKCPIPPATPV